MGSLSPEHSSRTTDILEHRRPASLPSDILARIFGFLTGINDTLCRGALVNSDFCNLASRHLYRHVQICSAFDVKPFVDGEGPSYFDQFSASYLPKYASYVEIFEIDGLSWIKLSPDVSDRLAHAFTKAMKSYSNLSTLRYTPYLPDDILFSAIIGAASTSPSLRRLCLKCNELSEEAVAVLCKVKSITNIDLISPNSTVLLALPNWLSVLDHPIKTLHLKSDCGAVTPGILSSLKTIAQSLMSFTLGVSYSLQHQDILSFFSQCRNLRHLDLYYNVQLDPPPKAILCSSLTHLRIQYTPTILSRTLSTTKFYTFIRRLIENTYHLTTLEIIKDTEAEDPTEEIGPLANFDGLIRHLIYKHACSMKKLDMILCFVGTDVFAELMRRSTQLEVVRLAVGIGCLHNLETLILPACRLHVLELKIVHTKRNRVSFTRAYALRLLQNGRSNLRRVVVNDRGWEGEWSTNWDCESPEAVFNVKEILENHNAYQ